MLRSDLKIRLAAPRGFCAGVDRAIQIVEKCIEKHGVPVYVRHEIVHNQFVVRSLEAKGDDFVKKYNLSKFVLLGFVGFSVTFIYDVLTLISYPLFTGLGYAGIIASLIKGLGFTVLHEISNIFIFLITVRRVIQFIKK